MEREYAAEWPDAANTTFFRLITDGVDASETGDGYRVTLEMAARYEPSNSTIEHVNRSYSADYSVTPVSRDGETPVCW